MSNFKSIADSMAANGRAALDDDSVYAQYQQLSPSEKAIADNMAANGRAALDDDSVYNQYQQLSTKQPTQSQQPSKDPLLANSDTNGQMTLEQETPLQGTAKVENAMGDPFANVTPGHVLATIKQLPQVIRYGTSLVPAGLGGLIGAIQDNNTAKEGAQSAYQQGISNEGVAGAVADPLNYIGGVLPASTVEAGMSRVLGSIPKVGKYAEKASAPATGLVSGLGLSAADQQINNGEVQAIPTVAGGLIGATGGLVSGLGGSAGNKASEFATAQKDPTAYVPPDIDTKIKTVLRNEVDNDPKLIATNYYSSLKPDQFGDLTVLGDADRKKLLKLSKEAIAEDPTNLYKNPNDVPNSEANNYFQKMIEAKQARSRDYVESIQPPKIDVTKLGNGMIYGGLVGGAMGHMLGGFIPTMTGMVLGAASRNPTVKNAINNGLNRAVPVIGTAINNAADNPASSSLFKGLYNLGAYGLPTVPSKADTSTWQ